MVTSLSHVSVTQTIRLIHLDGDVFSEGEPVKLRCKLEGQPLPQVTWYFDDREIEPSEHYTIISDFNEFILMAPRATLDMSGRYRIVAKNHHGAKQMSTQFVVEGQFPFFLSVGYRLVLLFMRAAVLSLPEG